MIDNKMLPDMYPNTLEADVENQSRLRFVDRCCTMNASRLLGLSGFEASQTRDWQPVCDSLLVESGSSTTVGVRFSAMWGVGD